MPVDVILQLIDFRSARRGFACNAIATEEEVGS
jgi:hypothetical protein